MTEYKCGDCFYAELCEKSQMFDGFSKDNYAYCSAFLNSADVKYSDVEGYNYCHNCGAKMDEVIE